LAKESVYICEMRRKIDKETDTDSEWEREREREVRGER
jgi:hypothetical protein